MEKGDRLGFIMFGSRTDIIFPKSVQIKVDLGDKVKGGETIIGNMI
jgi:phosphatidylserine decarboxylase